MRTTAPFPASTRSHESRRRRSRSSPGGMSSKSATACGPKWAGDWNLSAIFVRASCTNLLWRWGWNARASATLPPAKFVRQNHRSHASSTWVEGARLHYDERDDAGDLHHGCIPMRRCSCGQPERLARTSPDTMWLPAPGRRSRFARFDGDEFCILGITGNPPAL